MYSYYIDTYSHELHCNQFESFGFEPFDDFTDEPTMNTIGLDHDKASFGVTSHFWKDKSAVDLTQRYGSIGKGTDNEI